MDVVIESKIIEEKFKEAERRSMRRARKIDATQFIRTVWGGPLATHEEFAQMTGIATLEAAERGLSGRDIAALVAALASAGGTVIANPIVLRGVLGAFTAVTLAYPVGRRRWRRWSRRRSIERVEGDLLLLRSAIVVFLADRLYRLLNSNDGLGHLLALLQQPQQSSESQRLAVLMQEGIVYAEAAVRGLTVRAGTDPEVMAQAGALGSTVARLHDVVCKALETPWSNQVKRTAAKGAYKLWDQFVDIYAEQRGGLAVWGGPDPLPAPQKLPTFPGE